MARNECDRRPRAPRARRRGYRSFSPNAESLDPRLLLAAGSLGDNVTLDYVNMMNEVRDWTTTTGSGTVPRDANGWPLSDAQVIVYDNRVNEPWNGPDPNAVSPDMTGTYSLSFVGRATVTAPGSPATIQNLVYNPVTNTSTGQVVVTAGQPILGLNFAKTYDPASSTGAGVTDVRLIQPGYAADTSQLFTNTLLSSLTYFTTIRYLDADGANSYPATTNGQPTVLNWSQRRLPSDSSQTDDYDGKIGQSIENMVALANATNTDLWINVPGPATDDFVKNMAAVIKNGDVVGGVAYAGLAPNLKVYVEYSNEVWGGIYQPYLYNYNAAQAEYAAGGSTLASDGNKDPYTMAGRRYLERSMQVVQDFRSVYGADTSYATLRPVLGWQEQDVSYYTSSLAWFQTNYGAPSNFFYGMGNATYWSPTDYSSENAVISSLEATEASAATSDAQFTAIATYYNMKNVAYEGGPAVGNTAGTAAATNALAASRDPRMEGIVAAFYEDFYAAGGTLGNILGTTYSTWSPAEEWGLAELAQASNPSAAAKYRGVVDLASTSPVAVTAGTAIAASSPSTFAVTTDSLGTNTAQLYTNNDGYYLIRVATAGNYALNLNASNDTSGQLQLSLNDQVVDSTISMANGANALGALTLKAGLNVIKIHDLSGGWAQSTLTFSPVTSNAAAFVSTDATTQGNWSSAYGADGATAYGDIATIPAYAVVSYSNSSTYVWSQSTTDARALQRVSNTATRIAGQDFSVSSFSVSVAMTDGKTHPVTFYALDWDSEGRSERVDVLDGTTGAVLDTRNISSFSGGKYLTWNVTNSVVFKFTNLSGTNATVSGLFFGGAPAPKATGGSATFVRVDTKTEGSWIGVYGADGPTVFGDPSSTIPSYAKVSYSGGTSNLWAFGTNDVRALQRTSYKASRIAAQMESKTSFTTSVTITDGKTHKFSIYALDWDKAGRSERIDVLDGTTGALLDTRTISSFSNGEYLTWNISGSVVFKVTNLAGTNATYSGLFFN